MKQTDIVKSAFKEVYSRKNYIFLGATTAFIIYSLSVLSNNFSLLINHFRFKILFALLASPFRGAIKTPSLITILLISILGGILFSMFIFKLRRVQDKKKAAGTTGFLGLILGMIVPVCAPCGVGLLAFFGYTGLIASISFLPLKGLEISILAILLLLYAIFSISKSIAQKVCNI